ncbi:MAG: efflux RND transporter periplasmic adaptor subunit [Bacteroidaceae bacterium]|nr:efflux RND transporter periplasmic adaptor subunit [Bacteroidaceae bacterium]
MINTMKSRITLFVLALAALVSCGKKQGMPAADNKFVVQNVKAQQTELTTSYPASIKSQQDVAINAKVSGHIQEVYVNEGDEVRKGQRLFLIDPVQYQASVNAAEAQIKVIKANIATQNLNVENKKVLHAKGIISDFDLQSALNQLESLNAQLASAKAQLINAKDLLSFCTVTSPVNGVVGEINFRQGTLASPAMGKPLTNISNLEKMYVYFSMSEKQVLELGGQKAALESFPAVNLRLSNGKLYNENGKVAAISGIIDSNTGSVQIRVDFPNPERMLRSGGTGSIEVITQDSAAVMVPQNAVIEVQEKKFVYTLGAENKVKYTEIKVLSQNDGQNFIVTSGVNVNDIIVVEGITRLKDGMEITPITAEERAAIEQKSQQHMAEKKLPNQE